MIEIYVLASLMAVGYAIAKQQKYTISNNNRGPVNVNNNNRPSSFANSVYYNQAIPAARAIEERRAKHMQTKSQQPNGNVVGRFYREQQEQHKTVRNMAGEFVPMETFLNPEIQPFFGGAVRQMGPEQQRMNSSKLENFTGVNNNRPHKVEVEFFGDSDAPTNIFGNPIIDEKYSRDRIVAPMTKRNELPFQQEKVGAGHYDVNIDVRDVLAPKTVDQLRAANRPKLSGTEGRAMPGGIAGPSVDWAEKVGRDPRLPTKDKGSESYLVTTGAYFKPQMPSDPAMRNTVRSQATEEQQHRVGGATHAVSASTNQTYSVPDTTKKDGMLASGNGGYVSNVFKAFTAPVMDVLAFTLKDIMAVSKTISFSQPQVPAKPRIVPDDKPATTMKETLIYDGHGTGYVKGPEMTTVFSDQVAKTTIKETLEYSDHGGYISANKCMAVYDPDSIAVALKTTIRETMAHASESEYMRNTSASADGQHPMSRPEDDVRNTLKDLDVAAAQGLVFAPTAMERTNAGYINTNMNAKDTNKQELVGKTQLPAAFANKDMGYMTANPDAKDTTKQLLHHEHFGNSESTIKAETDRNIMDSLRTNRHREGIMEMRVPTTQGTKSSPAIDTLGQVIACKDSVENSRDNGNMRALTSRDDRVFPGAMTVLPKCTSNTDAQGQRFEMATMLKPTETNPFVEDILKRGLSTTD